MKKIPERINNIIQEFILEVNKILGNRVKKIILYGSYARGDFNKKSDIDIMILTDLKDEEIYDYFVKISKSCINKSSFLVVNRFRLSDLFKILFTSHRPSPVLWGLVVNPFS